MGKFLSAAAAITEQRSVLVEDDFLCGGRFLTMYGVDQCRRCGTQIQPHGPEVRAQVEAVMRSKKKMPEAQWRKLGLLGPPTALMMRRPAIGCCFECGRLLTQRKMQPFRRMAKALIGFGIAFAIIFVVATYVVY